MGRARRFTRAGLVPLLGVLGACGPSAADSVRAFRDYDVAVDATDSMDLGTGASSRGLVFHFGGVHDTSPATCGSFGIGATATFAGRPVAIPDPGGWTVNRIPTNTAPGETIDGSFCDEPTIEVDLANPVGEPQNDVLSIDGAWGHLEVPFMHTFGSPQVKLVTATLDQLVVSLQSFVVTPALADIQVMLMGRDLSVDVAAVALGADGQLTLTLARGAIFKGFLGSLVVSVNQGSDAYPCPGFHGCSSTSKVVRTLVVDIPVF